MINEGISCPARIKVTKYVVAGSGKEMIAVVPISGIHKGNSINDQDTTKRSNQVKKLIEKESSKGY